MLARYEIPSAFMKDAGRKNDEKLNDPDNRLMWPACFGLRVVEKSFFLLQGPRTSLLEFDAQGRKVREYWKMISYDFSIHDFSVQKTDATYFHLLASVPTPGVSVYKGPK